MPPPRVQLTLSRRPAAADAAAMLQCGQHALTNMLLLLLL
jgi:hypothetical protein